MSYLRKSRSSATPTTQREKIESSRKDAAKEVERKIHEAMTDEQGSHEIEVPADIKAKLDERKSDLKNGLKNAQNKAKQLKQKGTEAIKRGKDDLKDENEDVPNGTKKTGSEADSEGAEDGNGKSRPLVDSTEPKDEMAYEVNIDDLKDDAEVKAEAEMQPSGVQ